MRLFIRKLYLCILVLLHSRMLLLRYQNDRSNYLHVFPCLRLSFPFILLEVIACIRLLLRLLSLVVLKWYKLSVNQESILFHTKRELINSWLSTARYYLKSIIVEVTDIKLLNKDTYQQFKAHQEQDREESYALIFFFFSTERIVINAKMHRQKMLQTRIPALENLYKTKLN